MQEGSFRCDANVSVRRPGQPLGTRREIKNLNSFKFMQQAMDFEIRWQIEQIEDGHAIEQATVLFDPATGETRAMRTKEDAADYRYFPDPDLPPLYISEQWIQQVRALMPELPRARAHRWVSELGLPEYDAITLTQSRAMADYFEATQAACAQPKLASNWVMGELSRRLNASEAGFEAVPVPPRQLAAIIGRVADGTVSNNGGKQLLDALWVEAQPSEVTVDDLIDRMGLRQTNDTGALESWVDAVIAANPDNVTQVRAGKDKALNALVGQVMKASKGKANPAQVTQLIKARLA
jgi:aspartyl-tRNA(Asn)/glutamyl-tRNA(Gln) amidotransferase subunit B